MGKISFTFFVIAMISLTACQNSSSRTNTVAPAKLTKSEVSLLSALGVNKNNVFDVVVTDPNIKEIRIWADYYEKGKKKEKKFDTACGLNGNDSQNKLKILFQTNEYQSNDDNVQNKQYIVACIDESGSSRFEAREEIPVKEGGATYTAIDGEQPFTNETVTLSAILENDHGPISAFDINGIDHDKLKQYDRAYFIRAKGKFEVD